MRDLALRRISDSESFEWPWAAPTGLAIIAGAAGGGGGKGYAEERAGAIGSGRVVVFVPLYSETEQEEC